jgi:ribose 1,5-bisphosphokinase
MPDAVGATAPRGTLVLVVGPSGAGKDSIIDGAAACLAGDAGFVFARRRITRPAEAGGEIHLPVTEAEFERLAGAGDFLLHWRAHDLGYGLPANYVDDLAAGRTVIANVSRSVLDEARQHLRPVQVVQVTASPERLAARLRQRGREKPADIAERLGRAEALEVSGPDVVTLVNDGRLEDAITAFVAILRHAVN